MLTGVERMKTRLATCMFWLLAGFGPVMPTVPPNPPVSPEASVSAEPSPVDRRPIRIGVLGPLSGSNEPGGRGQLNAVILAVEEANADGGVNGRPLEVREADDAGLPDLSREGVRKLLDQGCAAILGAINSSCTRAAMAECAEQKVPILTSSSTASRLTSVGNKWVFRCIESDSSRMFQIAKYLVEDLGIGRIGILYEKDEFGQGLRDDLASNLRAFKRDLAYVGSFHRDQADFSALLEAAREKGVEALGLCGITPDNIRIAHQVKAMGLGVRLFAPDVNERYLAIGGEGVEDLVATDTFYTSQDKRDLKDFLKKYRTRFGREAGPHAGRAYDAARILVAALRRADPPGGETLREALLATENFPGLTGDFNFKPNGDVIKKAAIVAIHGGKFIPVSDLAFQSRQRSLLVILIPVLLAAFGLVLWTVARVRRTVREKLRRRAMAEFRPIRTNPYIVGNPVREKEMFFGREDDFQFIRKNLERRDSGACIVLCGERRSGKTSILYQVLNGRLGEHFVPVLIDLQLYGNVSDDIDFYGRMASEIEESLRKRGICIQPAGDVGGRLRLEFILNELSGMGGGRKYLLLFDEYEILETLIENDALHRATIDYLSGILEKYPSFSYVLTGSTRLEDRRTPYWRHLIGKSLCRKISFLTRADTLRLILEPLKGQVFYEEGVPERIWRLTAGQPFYTQAVCMNVVDHLNEISRNLVGAAELAAVTDQILENPLPQMLYFWESFEYPEKLVLSLLAEALKDAEDWVDVPALQAHADSIEFSEPLDVEGTNKALESLFAREMLNRGGEGFQFRMDLFRPWIQRDHSPWQVLSEG